ncbi:MAG: shikimate kinase [Oscillospiraceae bacterium]
MGRYELIGQKLGHSHSKRIHEALGSYKYTLRELPDEKAVQAYFAKKNFAGCNVTIPYKKLALQLCNEVDPLAQRIGAVNTVVNRGGRLFGYNTDYAGMQYMLQRKEIQIKGRTVLLLGNGATTRTAMAVVEDMGAGQVVVASRTPAEGTVSYREAEENKKVEVVLNVSPAGMYPNNGTCLVDINCFPALQAVADVVYNPLRTAILLQVQQKGLPLAGGLAMLVQQAVSAAALFTGQDFTNEDTEKVLHQTAAALANLVLVGMPSSGKSRMGRAVAKKLGRPFVDLDTMVEKQAGTSVPNIFKKGGEEEFRRIETQVLAEATKLPGRVISTGGGVATQSGNIPLLRQNGVVVFLDRPLHKLETGKGRPLSTSREVLQEMYEKRLPQYKAVADAVVENDDEFMKVVYHLKDVFYNRLDP